jgi:hypothetical protein
MKRTLGLGILMIFAFSDIYAQFYYKDIISTIQSKKEMDTYIAAGIHQIKINSIESDGENSPGFYCEKKITKDYKKSTLYTKSIGTSKSVLISYFNDNSQLIKTYDSSDLVVSTNDYVYDDKKRLIKIITTSQSNDDDFVNKLIEEHDYIYPENSILPERMYRIKNQKDSSIVIFSKDENDQIAIEKDTRDASKYYYYYTSSKQISDIVHTNEYKQKLVADYIFEYNNLGQISQMTTTEDGNDNFITWKYTYDNELKTMEKVYSKDGKLIGKLEYQYK